MTRFLTWCLIAGITLVADDLYKDGIRRSSAGAIEQVNGSDAGLREERGRERVADGVSGATLAAAGLFLIATRRPTTVYVDRRTHR